MLDLCRFVDQHRRLFVLSGAGMSTDSGIPGYRDSEGLWKRSPPVLLRDFVSSESTRQRYWARSLVGWPVVAKARPNAAHAALARLQAERYVEQLVTQNVDGLHQRAGSANVIELHGNLSGVVCLDCGARFARAAIQDALAAQNPRFCAAVATAAPDGDADLQGLDLASFRVPQCSRCNGILKPDVVFFGEGVPRGRVNAALLALSRSEAVLVIGSSLMVYSGYRFCEQAHVMGKPIAAVNLGRTRADPLLALKVERSCAEALGAVVEALAVA
jgi:NAD-dependent SIR2 family protein deacetylase